MEVCDNTTTVWSSQEGEINDKNINPIPRAGEYDDRSEFDVIHESKSNVDTQNNQVSAYEHALSVTERLKAAQKNRPTEKFNCEIHGSYSDDYLHGVCHKCSKQTAVYHAIPNSEIPARFKNKTIENFKAETEQQKKSISTVKNYVDNIHCANLKGQCLIFTGKLGTGKTHLACGVLKAAMRAGYTAAYTNVLTLIQAVRGSWNDKNKSETKIYRDLVNVDFLLIDEIGVQYGTDAEQIILFTVINARYERMKPTIVVSNLPIESEDKNQKKLRHYLGDRSYDRLREGGGKLITCDWESYRGQV